MSPSLATCLDDDRPPLPRRILRANWGLLAAAFSDDTSGVRWYLHTETGAIVRVVQADQPASAFLEDGYIQIERARSREQYRWMERYIAGIDDQAVAAALMRAITGKRAFQRFKIALAQFPGRTDDWYTFRGRELGRFMRAWLAANGFVVPRHAPTTAIVIDEAEDEPEPAPAERRSRLDAAIEDLGYDDMEALVALAEMMAQGARGTAAGSGPA